MSITRLFSLLGVSTFRNHLAPIHPILFTNLFPSPALRFHRYSSSSATLVEDITTDTTETVANSHHPWREWVTFVDRLKTKGYLLETPAAAANVGSGESGDTVYETRSDGVVYKDMNRLKDACLSFARDRFDILKSLSAKDIQTVVEKGCPNLFWKAVNSGKMLRAYVRLDEEDVSSGCNLRGSCDKTYVILKEPEAAACTVDIVRILLFYALDPLAISGGEKPLGRELIEVSARKLLSKLIGLTGMSLILDLPKSDTKPTHQNDQSLDFMDDKLSGDVEMKKGDWMCSKCNFMNFHRNMRCIKCGEDGPRRVGRDDIEMKKGDWVCSDCSFINFSRNVRCLKCKAEGPKRVSVDDVEMKKGDWNCLQCGFMNFASNTKCLRCREPRPKRQLNPGEWECPSCDFLNYRRNVVCKKCNCERPKEVESKYEEQT